MESSTVAGIAIGISFILLLIVILTAVILTGKQKISPSKLLKVKTQQSNQQKQNRYKCDYSTGVLYPCSSDDYSSNTFATLEEGYSTCRPGGRHLRWNLVNSETGECKPTIDANGTFTSLEACVASAKTGFNFIPEPFAPGGWICANRELNHCIPFYGDPYRTSYKVYPTMQSCKNSTKD